MEPPWFQILMACAAVFGLWLAYLTVPLDVRAVRLLLNALGRRGDTRTLGWLVAMVLLGGLSWGAFVLVTTRLGPELQYFVFTGAQLVAVVLAVLLVVSFITWLVLFLFRLSGQRVLEGSYVAFVGWNLLRSHRRSSYKVREYEGGRKPSMILCILGGLLCIGAAWYADKAPWGRWLGNYAVGVNAMRVSVGIIGLFLLSWPLRRVQPAGRIDLMDKAEAWVRSWPDLLTVTVTTFISITGVGVGVWALIVVLSVMGGFEADLRSKILSTNPHVVVQDDEPMEGIAKLDEKLAAFRAMPEVLSAIPYVQGEVIITSRENRNVSLVLRGIDPRGISQAEHHLRTSITAGGLDNLLAPERVVPTASWRLRGLSVSDAEDDNFGGNGAAGDDEADVDDLAPEPIPGVDNNDNFVADEGMRPTILLGKELAASLRVGVGGEVTVVSPRDDAGFLGIQPRARTFRVGGIFNTGMYEFDLKLAYVRISEAQRFFHMGSDVNRIELRLADVDNSEAVVAAIEPYLERKSLRAIDWKELNRNLFSALALEKIVMFIVLGFIILVASFNVIGSLVMIIMEKSTEIAVLKSLGSTRGEIARIFMVLGGFIGGIGSLAGLVVGLLTCGFIRDVGVKLPRQYYIDMLPVDIDPLTIGIVFMSGILLCLLATVYPATEAASVHPVEGLRYD